MLEFLLFLLQPCKLSLEAPDFLLGCLLLVSEICDLQRLLDDLLLELIDLLRLLLDQLLARSDLRLDPR